MYVIEQNVDIPASRRITFNLPQEIPAGKTVVVLNFKDVVVDARPSAPQTADSLASRFIGALRVSDNRYEEMQQALRDGRDEWTRNIL